MYWKLANGNRDRVTIPRFLGESILLFSSKIKADTSGSFGNL